MDSDSDSDVDVPEKNVSNYDSRADRRNQPKSSLNATQPIVVPAGTDVMFSLMSALSDSPKVQQTAALLTASMLNSSHSTAVTNSEGLLAIQNIDEVPCSNQEDANIKSVAELPYVKPFRERSKKCLGDLLEKRQYQKSPIILKLGSSNSPGVKTPIITSSSSSSFNRNNVTDNTANGNCVRLEADDDDWMEDVSPVKSSDSPVRKRGKNAKNNKITKTKENKSKKKDNNNEDKKTNLKEKKADDENIRNNGVKREDFDKEEDRLNALKDSVTAAPSDDYDYDIPVTTPRPLLMPLIPLNTLPPIPVLAPVLVPGAPVLTIPPSTATTNTPATCTRISAVVLTTTEPEPGPEQAQIPVGLISTPNASRRNLPKSLVPKESDVTAASNIISKIKNSKLLHELDATLRLKELPSLLKSDVEVSVLNTPSKPSRRIDIVNDVTGFCSSNVKKMNLEGDDVQ